MNKTLNIPDGWKIMTANDYCIRVADGTHDSPKRVYEGKYLVTSKNIIGGTLDLSSCYKISVDDYESINRRSKVDRNDVLLSMIGTVGECCFIDEEPDFAIKNVGLLKTNSRERGLWLHFFLRTPAAKSLIAERSRGTTQQYLTLGEIRSFPIPVPSTEEELAEIVAKLSVIREKIALNRKLNETLEGMARALFQSWFVDFDPVKAKLAAVRHGRDPERACMAALSGKLRIPPGKPRPDTLDRQLPTAEALDAAIAALDSLTTAQHQNLAQTASHFPANFQDSELGLIPEGWEVSNLDKILELAYGRALKKNDRADGHVPVYGSGGINGYHNKHLVEGPGIIVGRKGTVGSLYWEPNDFFPIDTVFYVKPKGPHSLIWIKHLLATLGLHELNTDAAVPGMNRNNVYRLRIPKFPGELVGEFSIAVGDLRNASDSNQHQSRTLADLRDTLLPKLLSGELSVGEMTDTVETVTKL